jgi:hypothetical protein
MGADRAPQLSSAKFPKPRIKVRCARQTALSHAGPPARPVVVWWRMATPWGLHRRTNGGDLVALPLRRWLPGVVRALRGICRWGRGVRPGRRAFGVHHRPGDLVLPGRTFASPEDFNTQLAGWLPKANARRMRVLGCSRHNGWTRIGPRCSRCRRWHPWWAGGVPSGCHATTTSASTPTTTRCTPVRSAHTDHRMSSIAWSRVKSAT